jgi:hypothetical protein
MGLRAGIVIGGICAAFAPLQAAAVCDPADGATPAAQSWLAEQGWRYPSRDAAMAAYAASFADRPTVWPIWFQPVEVTLAPGIRFRQALHVGQDARRPGRWGTFDAIRTMAEIRNGLAIRSTWGPYDRVAIYEVVQPMPVRVGPVGPLVDPATCTYLPGRGSQIELAPDHRDLSAFVKLIELRPIE